MTGLAKDPEHEAGGSRKGVDEPSFDRRNEEGLLGENRGARGGECQIPISAIGPRHRGPCRNRRTSSSANTGVGWRVSLDVISEYPFTLARTCAIGQAS